MEEWKEYKLAEVCENIYSGGTPSSMNASYWDGNLSWLSSGETSQRYIYNTEKSITKEGADNSSTRYAYKGSTVIASAGQGHTRGQASMLCIDTYVNQSVLVLKPNPLIINPYFLYFNLDSRYNELRQLSDGTSTRGSLSGKILKDLKIYLPPLNMQHKIASILKSLDDKIEVNRRINDNFVIEKFFEILLIWMLTIPINDNLEQQAQALFKSWFVDFEPFRDGEFVDSELGMIPKGWRVGTIDDICCFESGFAFKSATYKQEGEYKLITIKNVQDGYLDVNGSVSINEVPEKLPQYCFLNIGDILLSLTGNVGRCCFVDEENLLLNQRVAKLKPRVGSNWGYIYTLFRNCAFKERVISIARGTAQANLSPVETSKLKIIVPSENTLEKFSQIINGYYHIMIINMIESRRLATLRDTLLPKLMSGEIQSK